MINNFDGCKDEKATITFGENGRKRRKNGLKPEICLFTLNWTYLIKLTGDLIFFD